MSDKEKMPLKLDLHVHTVYSSDSSITLKQLEFWARKRGLTGVAVTDHNCVEGALKFARQTELLVIPGVEVSSRDGHVIGLNVSEVVSKGLTAEETIEQIHKLGGVAVACHPFALFKSSLGKHTNGKFDAIETINASASPFKRSVRKAEAIAAQFKLPRVAGTDAHYAPAIGYAYTSVNAEPTVDAVMKALVNGRCRPFGQPIPLRLKLEKYCRYFKRKSTNYQEAARRSFDVH